MRVVVALGGNALLRRGERPDATIQLAHVRAAAEVLAPLANEHELGICHGNGPQVGLLALESEADRSISRAYPFDALGAQTQGMIGYWLSQCLRNAGVLGPVLIVVTQVRVDGTTPPSLCRTSSSARSTPSKQRRSSPPPEGEPWRGTVLAGGASCPHPSRKPWWSSSPLPGQAARRAHHADLWGGAPPWWRMRRGT